MEIKSFYSIIEETFNNKDIWNYYSSKKSKKNPMLSEKDSMEFIRKFIQLSGKAENKLQGEINKIEQRATHIVSAFFIGHFIYQNTAFKKLIDEYLEKKKSEWEVKKVDFSFILFLVCLFHDLGYVIENGDILFCDSIESLEEKTSKLGEIDGVPKLYENVYRNYYKYRIISHVSNDHGITAAYLFYSSICKIRKLACENKDKLSGLFWGEELVKVYNFCAWNILAHNIWFCNESDEGKVKVYKHYRIDDLIFKDKEITSQSYKIDIKEYPLFFFFCLVDTIEPYKRVQDYEELKKIHLEYGENEMFINVISETDKYTLKDAEKLNEWLTPSTPTIQKKVIIKLSEKY